MHPKTKEVLVHAGKKITSSVYNHIKQAKVERFEVNPEDLEGAFASATSSIRTPAKSSLKRTTS
jgi:hypothetical protein